MKSAKLLGSSLNLRQNLAGSCALLAEYLDMKRGTVSLRSDNEVSILVAHGMSEEEVKRGRYRLGEGIIGASPKLGAPIVIPTSATTALPEQDRCPRDDQEREHRVP